jgi:hypothetical protein
LLGASGCAMGDSEYRSRPIQLAGKRDERGAAPCRAFAPPRRLAGPGRRAQRAPALLPDSQLPVGRGPWGWFTVGCPTCKQHIGQPLPQHETPVGVPLSHPHGQVGVRPLNILRRCSRRCRRRSRAGAAAAAGAVAAGCRCRGCVQVVVVQGSVGGSRRRGDLQRTADKLTRGADGASGAAAQRRPLPPGAPAAAESASSTAAAPQHAIPPPTSTHAGHLLPGDAPQAAGHGKLPKGDVPGQQATHLFRPAGRQAGGRQSSRRDASGSRTAPLRHSACKLWRLHQRDRPSSQCQFPCAKCTPPTWRSTTPMAPWTSSSIKTHSRTPCRQGAAHRYENEPAQQGAKRGPRPALARAREHIVPPVPVGDGANSRAPRALL